MNRENTTCAEMLEMIRSTTHSLFLIRYLFFIPFSVPFRYLFPIPCSLAIRYLFLIRYLFNTYSSFLIRYLFDS